MNTSSSAHISTAGAARRVEQTDRPLGTRARAGRQADALGAFARARTVLVERFDLDPSPTLVEIHRQVLENDDHLAAARPH